MRLNWPPAPTKNFVDLFCVESQSLQSERVLEPRILGLVDEVKSETVAIQLDDLSPLKNGIYQDVF